MFIEDFSNEKKPIYVSIFRRRFGGTSEEVLGTDWKFSDKATRPQNTFLIPQKATTWERVVCFMKKSILRRPGYREHDRREERVMGMKMEMKRTLMCTRLTAGLLQSSCRRTDFQLSCSPRKGLKNSDGPQEKVPRKSSFVFSLKQQSTHRIALGKSLS